MNKQLVEIQPKELKFIFELKKQSSCLVRLTNITHHYVAFKVKTTSPKKYCVRPNVGIILPKSTCDFTVTMQAQAVAPPDMMCKDKFLIQSTVVPVGTTNEDVTASMFAKEDGRFIQENKLKVVLISPPNSPVLSPINGALKQDPAYEASVLKDPVLSKVEILIPPPHMVSKNVEASKMVDGEKLKPAKVEELNPRKDFFNVEELKTAKDSQVKLRKDVINSQELKSTVNADLNPRKDFASSEELKSAKDAELKPGNNVISGEELTSRKDAELMPRKDVIRSEDLKSKDAEMKPSKDEANSKESMPEKSTDLNLPKEVVNGEELKPTKDTDFKLMKEIKFKALKAAEELNLVKDIEEMKSKLNELESKLSEAEIRISKLTEERRLSFQERKSLQEELEMLRSKRVVKNVQGGFPLLFVCMVALINFVLGRWLMS